VVADDANDKPFLRVPRTKSPSTGALRRAVESVLSHHALRPLIEKGGTQAYQPMPPYLDIQSPDGTVERMVTVVFESDSQVLTKDKFRRVTDGR
jgi:hypothetical protein